MPPKKIINKMPMQIVMNSYQSCQFNWAPDNYYGDYDFNTNLFSFFRLKYLFSSALRHTNIRSIWDAEWGHPRRLRYVRPEPGEGLPGTNALAKLSQPYTMVKLGHHTFDGSTTKLAKKVHGHQAPTTTYHALMPNSSVSICMAHGNHCGCWVFVHSEHNHYSK